MKNLNNMQKQLFAETSAMIAHLFYAKNLDENEMFFFLNLLDSIYKNDLKTEVIQALVKIINNEEKDNILNLKEKLLTIDWNDKTSLLKRISEISNIK